MRSVDIAVIGAGIVGAASAYRLAASGLKVLVLEQDQPASGSTGKSAAGVRAQFCNETNIRLSQESIAEYASMPTSGYCADGYLMLIPERLWETHREGIALQQRLGVPSEALTPQQAQSHVSFNTAGLAGCSFCHTDGFVDPHCLNFEYLRLAREAGAQVQTYTAVTGIWQGEDGWRLSLSQRSPHQSSPHQESASLGDVQATQVLNAAGAWSGEIGALAGLDIPVRPARRMVFASGPLTPPRRVPMVFDLESGVWLRSEGERLIFGRADPADEGWREGFEWSWLEPTLELALERFPWLAEVGLDRRASWWGYYEMTPDQAPILGRMPGVRGWLNACGFSGHGVMQAAAVGRVIAQEAHGETPFINIDPLRYERFLNGQTRSPDIQV